ncbi:MAG: hypothetical protein ACKOC5_00080, partial [Chloroflexota bacterium]
LPLPEYISRDALAILNASYLGRADKAKGELGWRPRSPSQGFRETFDWFAGRPLPTPAITRSPRRRRLAAAALGAALGVLTAYWVWRERR